MTTRPTRQLLAAPFLAAIRGSGGHPVYVVHSAHQLSLDAATDEHLLPLLWAVNNTAGSRLEKDRDEFHAAMDRLDQEGAERAVVALARSAGAHAVFDELWPYGALNCQP